MQCFAGQPLNVMRQRIAHETSYADIAVWLESNDAIATALRHSVVNENCVAFIQIGGEDCVMCCVPNPSNPLQCMHTVRQLKKSRGTIGEATLLLYK